MATILVVDDRPTNREFMVTLLGYRDHRLIEATDGAEALALVRSEHPDLVIADILMPTMDGYELVRQLRADPTLAQIQVIFYTAHYHEQEARALAQACGVAHILTKPSEPDLVLRTIDAALGLTIPPPPPPAQDAFDREHLRVLTDKLSQHADELRNANLQLGTLIEISLQLAAEHDPQRLLEHFCHTVRNLIGAKYAAVGVLGADQRSLQHFFISGMDAEMVASIGLPTPWPAVLGNLRVEGRARRRQNAGGDPSAVGFPPAYPAIHTILAAPIASLAHVYGWICLTDKIGVAEFSEEDERLVVILASHVGQIYENGRLYREAQRYAAELEQEMAERKRAEASLQRYAERLQHLRAIDQSILASRSLLELAQAALVHIGHLIPSTRVALVLIDLAAETMTLFALQVRGEIRVPPVLQAPLQILGAALEPLMQGQVYQVEDIAALPAPPAPLIVAQVEHVQAYFYMPIMAGSELIALLNVGSDQPGAFSAEYLDIAREVADQLSIAIQQARLHEQIQQHARELEQRVIARTSELESANKELEAFSYSVSHDLRSPLRAIDGFSRILLEDYLADLPNEAQHYLQVVRDNTQQMGRLVDDLLAFARLSRHPLKQQPVALAGLVRQCIEDLRAEQVGRCVEITIGDLPECAADPALLKQVWINLIANALKYTRRQAVALIEIGCQTEEAELIYFIKDNGVGFDMRYSDKLFGVFQRMHRAEEYEGTGVGLAIVQRIIHRHGGRIWAEAEVNRGAAFYYILGGGSL